MVDLINAIGVGILYTGIVVMFATVVAYAIILSYVLINDLIDNKKED